MGLSTTIANIFSLRENSSQNLNYGFIVNRQNMRSHKFCFETFSTIEAIVWNDLPAELKNAEFKHF